MSKENRLREHTRAVWRRGYDNYLRSQRERRCAARPAVEALLSELRHCASEEELHARYWEPGDWPADLLRRHLPSDPGDEALLEIEDAAFWIRCQELEEDR